MAESNLLTRLSDQLAEANNVKIVDRPAFEQRVLNSLATLLGERLYLLEARKLGMVADLDAEESKAKPAPAPKAPEPEKAK